MAKEDDQKAMGRLEKGVEVLEKTVASLEKGQTEHQLQVITTLRQIQDDFRREIANMHTKLDDKTDELHKQIDGVLANHTSLKLNVSKLASTVSIVVGVGLYIATKVFDVAKDAFAATFMHH